MSESLVLKPSSVPGNTASRMGFGTRFKAFLTSLVAAQARRFENIDPLMFRYPPI